MDPKSKLAEVRNAMASGDWELAIKLAAKFKSLGVHKEAIHRARDAINNPKVYQQLGFDLDSLRANGIVALKERFNLSWQAVQNEQGTEKDND